MFIEHFDKNSDTKDILDYELNIERAWSSWMMAKDIDASLISLAHKFGYWFTYLIDPIEITIYHVFI